MKKTTQNRSIVFNEMFEVKIGIAVRLDLKFKWTVIATSMVLAASAASLP